MRPPDVIKSQQDLHEQYKEPSNLKARAAIYRFAVGKAYGSDWLFDRLLETIPTDADVLDVGSGPGGLWQKNKRRVPRSWRILNSHGSDARHGC